MVLPSSSTVAVAPPVAPEAALPLPAFLDSFTNSAFALLMLEVIPSIETVALPASTIIFISFTTLELVAIIYFVLLRFLILSN